MLRVGRGSAFTGEVTLPIEVGFERGTLSIRGGNGVLRNPDGTVAAHLRTSGRGITFYEPDGTTLRGYAEEFNGTIRLYLYRVNEFVFEASEPIRVQMNRASFASPTPHDQRSASEATGAATYCISLEQELQTTLASAKKRRDDLKQAASAIKTRDPRQRAVADQEVKELEQQVATLESNLQELREARRLTGLE